LRRSVYAFLASIPDPIQFSVTYSTEKQERAWVFFPHKDDIRIEWIVEWVQLCVGAQDPEQQKEPWYQVTYQMYLASKGGLSCIPSVEHVVS